MKRRFKFSIVSLALVLLASACAPAATNAPATEAAAPEAPTATVAAPATPSAPEATATSQPVEVQAVATSRGPNLEATDPATVSLAAGQLQLVEFFRFT
ncbi:MAG: hypothetical protein KA473_13455 [Anaerolineales bacterium]|jgi:hypothetical protein|nr:hypothetical protein [Anaerolineales bacterium]